MALSQSPSNCQLSFVAAGIDPERFRRKSPISHQSRWTSRGFSG